MLLFVPLDEQQVGFSMALVPYMSFAVKKDTDAPTCYISVNRMDELVSCKRHHFLGTQTL